MTRSPGVVMTPWYGQARGLSSVWRVQKAMAALTTVARLRDEDAGVLSEKLVNREWLTQMHKAVEVWDSCRLSFTEFYNFSRITIIKQIYH